MKTVVYGHDAQKMREACSENVLYRNPTYFKKLSGADRAILLGDFPEVEAAYKAAGIECDSPSSKAKNAEPEVKKEAPKTKKKATKKAK